jgi:hypothetical protein
MTTVLSADVMKTTIPHPHRRRNTSLTYRQEGFITELAARLDTPAAAGV